MTIFSDVPARLVVGVLAAAILLAVGGMPVWAMPLPVVACWTLLFPIVMYSMLAENSMFAIYSSRTAALDGDGNH